MSIHVHLSNCKNCMRQPMKDQKLFRGPRVRRLRRERAITQARMAEELGISTSYLNLIERNQRPVTAPLLIRLAEVYAGNLRDFAGGEEAEWLAHPPGGCRHPPGR